jgi:hypothetical protein
VTDVREGGGEVVQLVLDRGEDIGADHSEGGGVVRVGTDPLEPVEVKLTFVSVVNAAKSANSVVASSGTPAARALFRVLPDALHDVQQQSWRPAVVASLPQFPRAVAQPGRPTIGSRGRSAGMRSVCSHW